jgi:hypothetical protein
LKTRDLITACFLAGILPIALNKIVTVVPSSDIGIDHRGNTGSKIYNTRKKCGEDQRNGIDQSHESRTNASL